MKKLLIASIILIALGSLIIFLAINSNSGVTGNVISEGNSEVKKFVITGENFKFMIDGVDNPDIEVNRGDKVRIEFTSTKGFHDWVVDEFNATTKQVRETDDSTFVEFIADKKGTFEYYCSVGKHRANGMKGNLIVK
ncbi:MAG: plastocyanin/azurin family copper-binding protein [Nanoarchaeota archaeon]